MSISSNYFLRVNKGCALPALLFAALVACNPDESEPKGVVDGVLVSPETATVLAGQSVGLQAEVEGVDLVDTSVAWSLEGGADDDSLTDCGLFTAGALDEGTREVIVIAASNEDPEVQGTSTVTVEPLPADVQIVAVAPTTATLGGGQEMTFTATVAGSHIQDDTVTWSLDDADGDTIDDDGVFTAGDVAAEARTVTVTATSLEDEDAQGTATVTVQPMAVHAVAVTPAETTLAPEGTVTLSAVVLGQQITDQTVSWSLAGEGEGDTVTDAGLFTAYFTDCQCAVTET